MTNASLQAINDVLSTVFPDSSFSISDQRPAPYTTTQRITLETIAEACPYDYGPGVYMARTLLSERDTVLYLGINDCEKGPQSASERRGEEEEIITPPTEAEYFKAYPNPFTSRTTIEYDLGKECEFGCVLRLFDLQGRVILQQRLWSENGKGRIDVWTCYIWPDSELSHRL